MKFPFSSSSSISFSDTHVRFVRFKRSWNEVSLKDFEGYELTRGIIEGGKIKDDEQLVKILKNLKKRQGIKSVRVSLPEDETHLFIMNIERKRIGRMHYRNLRKFVQFSFKKYTNIPKEDVVFEIKILSKNEKFFEIQVALMDRKVLARYFNIFKKAGITVKSFEPEGVSLMHSLVAKKDKRALMIVNVEYSRAGVFVVYGNAILFTSTIDFGDKSIFDMFEEKIEKNSFVLTKNMVVANTASGAFSGFHLLKEEISKYFLYWHTRGGEEGKERPAIKEIILCGEGAKISGLSEYLAVSLKTPVSLANVWVNVLDPSKEIPSLTYTESLSFAQPIGASIREFK
ncbi:MAG: pilus assembly protein PilM [Candidatus Pacebacteria bacterium]|nr:pilus assembly protein PilM [Candidatus Paceibacterota bacterium]MCF7862448.1 pilus assembly protein PilM [Candidatus Paceibacterota bacterium]